MRAVCMVLALAAALAPLPAAAQLQAPGPPGPYVIDLKVGTSSVPSAAAFFTEDELEPPDEDTLVSIPGHGLSVDVGAHVYAGRLGPARLGFGANLMRVSGSTDAVTTTVTSLAPQVSFNFGNANGWSYLSAGYGRAQIRESGWVPGINLGGGARWFMTRHAAFVFDLRYYRFSGGDITPSASMFAISAGVSLR